MVAGSARSSRGRGGRLLNALVLQLLIFVRDAAAGYSLPAGYSLEDPSADHIAAGKGLSESGQGDEAVESFRAACRHTGGVKDYANLGVALMRVQDFATAYLAMTAAQKMDPHNNHVKSNMKALIDFAKQQGVSKDDLKQQSRQADLKITSIGVESGTARGGDGKKGSKGKGRERDFEWNPAVGASDFDTAQTQPRILTTAASIASRGRELIVRGEKRLGRGFLSLALHLDPFLRGELPRWFTEELKGDIMNYWGGNIFIGHDKTALEALTSKFALDQGPESHYQLIFLWRGLQLTRESCCGADNLLYGLARIAKFGHGYVVPFVQLVPELLGKLKPDSQNMFKKILTWWEQNGRPPMPDPAISYQGHGVWEWPLMKVVLAPDRVPPGWGELVQAILLRQLGEYEGMRACLWRALHINDELNVVVDELLPGLSALSSRPNMPRPVDSHTQYVIQYNPFVGLGNLAASMVSAYLLAKVLGRTLIIHWNVNVVSRHAFQMVDQIDAIPVDTGAYVAGILHNGVRNVYLFQKMDGPQMSENLELLGCTDLRTGLGNSHTVTVSSDLFFAPIIATNPHTSPHLVHDFPKALAGLLRPSPKAVKRALNFATKTNWGSVPTVAVHIRAREPGEDNSDWPTKEAPDTKLVDTLRRCVLKAVERELRGIDKVDVFVASSTNKARSMVGLSLKGHAKVQRVLKLPNLDRNRGTGAGTIDAMAEALLISRADVFVRLVIGTSGYSNFAGLSNALRVQDEWASALPALRPGTETGAPNYVVTEECAPGGCFKVPSNVQMADIAFHGPGVTKRSCGDVVARVQDVKKGESFKCKDYHPVEVREEL